MPTIPARQWRHAHSRCAFVQSPLNQAAGVDVMKMGRMTQAEFRHSRGQNNGYAIIFRRKRQCERPWNVAIGPAPCLTRQVPENRNVGITLNVLCRDFGKRLYTLPPDWNSPGTSMAAITRSPFDSKTLPFFMTMALIYVCMP